MSSSNGYATITEPGGVTKEFDTLSCCHCNAVFMVKATEISKPDPGGFCRLCMAPICPQCIGKYCVPFMKRLDLYESRQDLFKKMGLNL